ncbi:unnamed protein product [Clonostachys chloroleuca]|uniref:Major facilitator superfamily (MFS) profile domain-containing protein n=1 Tax=Clonostachys chloroleuca TaxID=1926264 RepID=A0AA35MAM6_9HYPO|nr:unnamed protein product [Clonostachys chloroleuca]
MDRNTESKSPLGGQAEEVEEALDLDIWAAAKKWHRIVWYCFGLTSCIMMYGYDYVIVGTVSAMPSFQEDYGQKWGNGWILPSLWLGLWNFASPGASMVGAILGGFMQDWTGRRMCIAVGSFLSAIGVAILFISNLPSDITSRRVVFLVGKGFQGMAIGMVLTTTQTYMSEVLPPILRGSVIAFIPTFVLLGQLIGAGVIYGCTNIKDGYIICFGTQWLFSAVPMVVAYIIPESPTYLIRKERIGDALKAQEKLFSPGMDSQAAIDDIRHNIDHEREQAKATYLDCFRGTNRRRTLIIMFSNLLPQFFGLLILSKASYFAQVVGMKAKLSLIVLVFGILAGFIANLISIWVISKYGRRLLILLSLSVAGVLWASMGVAGIWSGPVVIWYVAIVMIVIVVVSGLGAWPASYAVASEASSLDTRAKAQGIGWLTAGFAGALFGFCIPYIFNSDEGNLGAKTGFVHTGFCLVGVVGTYYFIPEMKDRTPGEIDRMFELNLDARKFKSWSRSSEHEP